MIDFQVFKHSFLNNPWHWRSEWTLLVSEMLGLPLNSHIWGEVCNLRFQFMEQYPFYRVGKKVHLFLPSDKVQEIFEEKDSDKSKSIEFLHLLSGLPAPGAWCTYFNRARFEPVSNWQGYLENPFMWSGDFAEQTAANHGIALTPKIWEDICTTRFQFLLQYEKYCSWKRSKLVPFLKIRLPSRETRNDFFCDFMDIGGEELCLFFMVAGLPPLGAWLEFMERRECEQLSA